jgi:hypothetical protein
LEAAIYRRTMSKAATNTNTDVLCCDDDAGFLTRAMYRYNLWTGLYMLEQDERIFFHLFGWVFLFSLFLYLGVFFHGFIDGVRAELVAV